MRDLSFDRLARSLDALRSRRSVMALLAGLLATPTLTTLHGDAKKKGKGKKKPKKKCKPEEASQTCAGRCGSTMNNCKKLVDCGACTPPCTVKPTDELQAAIDAAAAGSTLRLCAGTWVAGNQQLLINKDLTLIGAAIDQTILDGQRAGRVLVVSAGNVTLQDLTITRGYHFGNGGGIHNSGSLTLRNVAVTENTANRGGGIHAVGSVTIKAGTRVTGNSALASGTYQTGGGILGTFTLESGSTVSGNYPDDCEPNFGTCT